MVDIREATEEDIEVMLILLDQLFSIEQDFTPDREKQCRGLKMLLDATGALVVVAEYDGQVVGMATLQTVISTAEGDISGIVEDLVVSESYRGKGIGRSLMHYLRIWADQKGLRRLQLLADKDNQHALNFYRKQGWSMTQLIALRK